MYIYRYISYEDFTRIVYLKKDRAARPTTWKDSYEGYLFKYMDNEEAIKKLISEIYWNVSPRNYIETIRTCFKLWHSKAWAYGLCWTMQEESELMWRANAYNGHAIRIKASVEDVREIIKNNFDSEYFGLNDKEVEYDLENSSDEMLKRQIDKLHINLAVTEPYFHKTNYYFSEYEYRFIIQDNRYYQVEDISCNGALQNINDAIGKCKDHEEKIDEITKRVLKFMCNWDEKRRESNIFFDIPENYLKKYVQSVIVHPDAEKWYVDLIKEICCNKKINFEGKSVLYDKIVV